MSMFLPVLRYCALPMQLLQLLPFLPPPLLSLGQQLINDIVIYARLCLKKLPDMVQQSCNEHACQAVLRLATKQIEWTAFAALPDSSPCTLSNSNTMLWTVCILWKSRWLKLCIEYSLWLIAGRWQMHHPSNTARTLLWMFSLYRSYTLTQLS